MPKPEQRRRRAPRLAGVRVGDFCIHPATRRTAWTVTSSSRTSTRRSRTSIRTTTSPTNPHYHVTHNWSEQAQTFQHLTSQHGHSHDHANLNHSHFPHEDFDAEHQGEAHDHDHSEPVRDLSSKTGGVEQTAEASPSAGTSTSAGKSGGRSRR